MENFTPVSGEKSQAPRKRLGRPPKGNTPAQAAAIEAAEDLDASAAAENSGSTSPTLCRRSTRKKIVKFDVLDVLNKSRKTHKIQIEARIDSNTPTGNVASTSVQAATPPPPPVNRLIATRAPLPSTPVLPALEMFTKPKPTPSLIVVQVSSDKTQELPLRKRGRPRKKQSMDCPDLDDIPSTSFQEETIETTMSGESSDSNHSLNYLSSQSNLELLDENALEANQESNDTEIITVLQSDEEGSDSQIIFVEIETETAATEEAKESDVNSVEERNFELIFPKEDISNASAEEIIEMIEEEVVKEEAATDVEQDEEQVKELATDEELIAEELAEPANVCLIKGEIPQQEEVVVEEAVEELETTNDAELVTESVNLYVEEVEIEEQQLESQSPTTAVEENVKEVTEISEANTEQKILIEVAAPEAAIELKSFKKLKLECVEEKSVELNQKLNKLKSEEIKLQLESKETDQRKKATAVEAAPPTPSPVVKAELISTKADSKSEVILIKADSKPDRNPIKAEFLHTKTDSNESRTTEKKKTSDSPGPSPKKEKIKIPIVESDALFKVLDEANAQMRHEEKTKKKLKQSAKKQKEKQQTSRQSSLTPPVAAGSASSSASARGKKSQSKKGSRRNTISEDPQEKESLPKRRNSLHPFKASPSPERRPEAEAKPSSNIGKKPKEKKAGRKAAGKEALESTSSVTQKLQLPDRRISTPVSEVEAPNPLLDIAKFIADGVKLLERDFKVDDEQSQEPVNTEEQPEDEFATRVANLETPATTPTPSPAVCTEDLSSGVRRSHRIKQKPQGTKSSVGRGRSSHTPAISMEQQLSELAHIENINEQFLRHEGLQTFQTLRDNYYRCARQVSKENAEMQCDCFITGDEEGSGQLRCGDGCINRMLMIECGPLCTNGDRCTNKRFQQHQGWPCRVFRTEKKGCGITAELQIPSGEFIMEYVGEVIDSEEFERRQHLYSEDRNRHYYFMALRGEAIIDATSKGNISRYINHSCDPNAETQKWTVNGELRIGFFSVKSILPGEEITFDYQYQRYGRDAQRCYCESANCRGWIGNEPESDEGEGEQLDTESDSEPESLGEEPRLEQGTGKSKPSKGAKPKTQSKLPVAARRKRKGQPKAKDREYKAGRWLRPSGRESGGKSATGKHDHVEDPDVLEQLTQLSRSGLKNQQDTLDFSRCMVRAKLLQSRLQLLSVLTRGELPCRRLFLDYHGLRLMHAWISESGSDKQLRLALLDALESLPIPNKTMLNDSRVYQSVELWSTTITEPPEGDIPRILALLQKWNGLPEIFRIPKRERIEQMKEHEREADRQQLQPALEESNSNSASSVLSSDRYRQDRFRRDTTSSRYEKSKPPSRMSGNNTICTITTTPSSEVSKADSRRSRSDYDPRRTISKEMRRSLFEQKVALVEAEKRVGSEDFREHELRCKFFGADLNTDPKLLPHAQNSETKEWFNSDQVQVPAPARCGDILEPPPPEEPEDVEYALPADVEPLPLYWNWGRTPEGDVYYYHLRDRIPQWEPPSAEQRQQKLVEDLLELPEQEAEDPPFADELVDISIDFDANLSPQAMNQYIERKIRERREKRRQRLVSVRVISPRREEDRLYNQQESRKYKENKEKIRRRKEHYRRIRNEASTAEPPEDQPSDALPIHRYLYSSDEEAPTDADGLPDGDGDQEQPQEAHSSKRKLSSSMEGHKKSRSERDKKRKTGSINRDASDKFHFEISGHVAEFLRPYRQDTCELGRITSDEDCKFLIKRLSHHITTKEMRYCDSTGNPLVCSESVKHKSYDFITQYMCKKGPIYKKPTDKDD